MTTEPLTQTLIIIAASAVAVAIFVKLRLPAIIGYLLAGLLIGPHGLGLIQASEEARFLAELGFIFLLFTIGLEFSIPALIAARGDILGAGGLQVALTVLPVAGCAVLFSLDWPGALLLGAAVAMSSTAITLKQLADQGEISSTHGRLALSILLFQDLATIPFLVMIGVWAGAGDMSTPEVLRLVFTAAAALALAALVSRPLFRLSLAWVARTRSAELFLIFALLVALGTAFVLKAAGLTAPVGAFIAGMVIGESDFRYQVEDDIRPFRDLLIGLFFVTVGMQIDAGIALTAPWAVAVWLAIFLFGKAGVVFATGTLMRWRLPTRLRTAVILAHGGEFGLLLLTSAMMAGMLAEEVGQSALVALVVTMGLAPLLIQQNALAERLAGISPARTEAAEAPVAEAANALENHVLLCGCGRIGRLVAAVLEEAEIPYLALELDPVRFRQARQLGCNVVFGDAARYRILDAAGVQRARLVVLTFDGRHSAERVLRYARKTNPGAPTIASIADDREGRFVADAGAAVVFPENLAAGLALADQTLLMCGFTQDKAAQIVTAVRAELNPELRDQVGI